MGVLVALLATTTTATAQEHADAPTPPHVERTGDSMSLDLESPPRHPRHGAPSAEAGPQFRRGWGMVIGGIANFLTGYTLQVVLMGGTLNRGDRGVGWMFVPILGPLAAQLGGTPRRDLDFGLGLSLLGAVGQVVGVVLFAIGMRRRPALADSSARRWSVDPTGVRLAF